MNSIFINFTSYSLNLLKQTPKIAARREEYKEAENIKKTILCYNKTI